jgi:[glutamine synthetase] adenylyltransferase / [glutamine synthetase]-adenylyl-L-tyrosine phosphorylase
MPSRYNHIYDILFSSIAELSHGNADALQRCEIPPDVIREIHKIMNIYSSKPPQIVIRIISLILRTPSPGRGLLRFEHFLRTAGSCLSPTEQPDDLCRILATIFSWSGALSGKLNGDQSLIQLLEVLEDAFAPRLEKVYYRDALNRISGNQTLVSERIRSIHRFQIVQLMRICARNADPLTDVSEISAELSLLAESVIEACLSASVDDLSLTRGKQAYPLSFIVLGLGKLGGMELNVSSDIDLIFLYDELEDHGDDNRITYYILLAERLIRFLTEPTDAGILYRVDTRLRADGSSGPLVRSTKDYFRYLEMRGEAWERQMLLKARPVAGELQGAREFLDSIERFIFTASITRSPNREIVLLKNQIEARIIAEGSKKTHLKLMPGGIRDIEFIVQCLQLLMGGIHPEVRSCNTLKALESLMKAGALSEDEYRILSRAYRRFRQTENAIQWKELLPAFTLPDSETDIEELSEFLGYKKGNGDPVAEFSREIQELSERVRNIFMDIFSPGGEDSFEDMAVRIALGQVVFENEKRFLESLGFPEPEETVRNLIRLVNGKEPGLDSSVQRSVERFIPKLLHLLSELPDPGGALERFTRIVDSYSARYTLFDILAGNPGFMELVASISHNSLFLTDILVKDPSLLDWLVEIGELHNPPDGVKILKELQSADMENESNDAFTRACLLIKNREELRIGSRSITGLADTKETFSNLASLAECIVKTAYARAFRQLDGKNFSRLNGYSFTVMAAGRLGAGMMDFGSDLDLIFVYYCTAPKRQEAEISEYSAKLSRLILSLITGGGGINKMYDVDARLRPEGGTSVLAISLEKYKNYLDTRAVEWERLALVRARQVSGNIKLGVEIESAVRNFVYKGRLTPDEIRRIMKIRTKMTESSQKRYPGHINVKSGKGGLADIDFAVQTRAVHYGKENPEVMHRDTLDILKSLVSSGHLDRHAAATLRESYRFLQDTEKSLRISLGRAINTLPDSGSTDGARAARLLGFRNTLRFIKKLENVICLTQELYDRLMRELLSEAEGGSL